tara:strand:+ start:983 stop:1312 length:330 start_codon:yes stop_codon:yes gene_type:complete
MLGMVSVSAATAVLGYDLATNTEWQQAGRWRKMVATGLKGSAAALDTQVRIMIGSAQVGTQFNSGTGAPNRDDMFRIGSLVPPNTEVHFFISDAASTNPINLACDFEDL